MVFRWLKRILPRGLYGRAILILIVPVVALQLIVSNVFLQRHFDKVTQQMTQSVVISLSYLLSEISSAPDIAAAKDVEERLAPQLGFIVTMPASPIEERRIFYDLSGKSVISTLNATLSSVQAIDLGDLDFVRVWADTPHGLVEVSFFRSRVSASNPHQLLVIMVFAGILMTAIAYGFLRNQLRPITKLADAAEAFGRGRIASYRPRGATEVRAAGAAFLDMRNRIERAREQRTLLLSGVSHDLRTPLTRLRLGLSLSPDSEDNRAMVQDVADMENMLDGFLAFARDEAEEDETVSVVPAELAERIVQNAGRIGREVALTKSDGAHDTVQIRVQPVERALDNLVQNALRYADTVSVTVETGSDWLRFVVEDDGPGIAPEHREEALRPFTRLDPARNQDKGSGTGLGLAIAMDVARGHGGTLRLSDSALGGLKAELLIAC